MDRDIEDAFNNIKIKCLDCLCFNDGYCRKHKKEVNPNNFCFDYEDIEMYDSE